ncbi:MAG TPA: sigma-70 family RNA polymerase sigma factor [Thermoanaerobaculia bacterium]|nr:sigma-70 family RNA polymerase sigma factor [Thermoanaerobaculia bacterium]
MSRVGGEPAKAAPSGPVGPGAGAEPSDLDLVRGIKAGDEGAFEKMVQRYHTRVYSLSYGVLRNAEDAEEATQDTFLTLYRKIGTFDESKKFFSWFYRVALNQAYSRARRRRPALTVPIDDYLPKFASDGHLASADFSDWSPSIEDDAIARELAGRAGEFISELSPAYRDAIWMYDVEGMSTADVAETLEISIPALKSRLHRARLYVRERLSAISKLPAPDGAPK